MMTSTIMIVRRVQYFQLRTYQINKVQEMRPNHVVSCFEGTLNGWNESSPSKNKHTRQFSLLHQLQQNLNRYQDENNRLSQKCKHQPEPVRLPLLTNVRSNDNIGARNSVPLQIRTSKSKLESYFIIKKALPLRMKTLMIYENNENDNNGEELELMKAGQRKSRKVKNQEKEKFRNKVIVKFQRVKELGRGLHQFSDSKFFKDSVCFQDKSKSVKLHSIISK